MQHISYSEVQQGPQDMYLSIQCLTYFKLEMVTPAMKSRGRKTVFFANNIFQTVFLLTVFDQNVFSNFPNCMFPTK